MLKLKGKNLLTIILARKGSRRILNKNLRKIGKFSLSEITIKFALNLKKISDIIVSTDDIRIIRIAKKYQVIIPGLRPKHLSGHKSSSLSVVKYIIKWYEKKFRVNVGGIILLQPTSPFRKISLILDAVKSFKKTKYNYVSISNDKSNKKKNTIYLSKENFLEFPNKKKIANCYTNGNFYILNSNRIMTNTISTLLKSKTKGILVKSKKISLDIDTESDLKKAKNYSKY